MDVVEGIERLTARHGRLFVVVGVFDGLHRGHAYLLRRLVKEAARQTARPAVVTFDAHPDEILTGSAPPLLVDPAERLTRLAGAGVAVTVVQHFDQALRETPFEAFVRMITDRVALAGFLMTPDAAFGYQRGGTPAAVATLGRQTEPRFDVAVVPPFVVLGAPVRSSEIRTAITAGDLDRARMLLGRAHAVVGDRDASVKGTRLTFPMPVALPPDGRYDARVSKPAPSPSRTGESRAVVSVEGQWIDVDRSTEGSRLRVRFTGARSAATGRSQRT